MNVYRSTCIAIALVTGAAISTSAVENPKPDKNGDYPARTSHRNWIVVDPDPNGLNCRWSSAIPTEWYSPSAKFPTTPVTSWRVVRRFKKNTAITANDTPAGFVMLPDQKKTPWLKVSIGPKDQICLVRANAKFVRPIQR